PGPKYTWQFKAVNDASINAFGLPGGFLYVNCGTIEAADNEAELAGVIGHEIGHVVLRHGTNQASKAELWQGGASLVGGVLGNSVGGLLTKYGTSFAVGSILLKYSRDAERQADLMGTQILFDCNYDPRMLAQFFEKLQSKGGGTDFFSDHPNPDKRMQSIETEVDRIGRHTGDYVNDSTEFHTIQQRVRSMPPPPKTPAAGTQQQTSGGPKPQLPSGRYQNYEAGGLSFRYPDNWKVYGKEQSLTVAPDVGIVQSGQGSAVAYGMIRDVFAPTVRSHSNSDLEDATEQLIQNLVGSNPSMKVAGDRRKIRVGGQEALSTMLNNDSPLGGRETDWLLTVLRPEGLVYLVFVAPEKEFADYRRTFEEMLNSLRFTGDNR
ncbi:MAG TPA: M48 family metalloprotease, partial [Acidobacteriota bacterium]|nr:M48 family metalloprotease [Acidobacteriota bacterium]